MSGQGSIQSALRAWIEPWMDVLLIGFSADALADHSEAAKVHCARSQRRPIAGTFDCVALWIETGPPLPLQAHLDKLRGGGLLALGHQSDLECAQVQELIVSLSQSHQCLGEIAADDNVRLLVFRQLASGDEDLVGLRRARHRLMASLQRVDRLAEIAANSALSERMGTLIAALADEDRYELQPWLRAQASGSSEPPPVPLRGHSGRPLVEEALRFRHFRSATLEALAALSPEAWHAKTPSGLSAAQTVRAFADLEDRRLADIERALCPTTEGL